MSRYFYKDPITGEEKSDYRLVLDSEELHCGDTIEALLPEGWKPVRVEKSNIGWYLTGTNARPIDLIARIVGEV